ncbi:hypothetical protein AnigIFM63604_003470 [Aspergillus niger]|uniref:Uncharacterized protein n=1 Tax=Aspergillus niger TaxID=5061 RepID=A0A9W6AEU7_ASPNG|nr:hypothetical protein AnigIFM63604_003470 [Aspergillus niger]
MEVANDPYNDQQTASNANASSKTAPTGVRMSLGPPGEIPPSDMALAYPEQDTACGGEIAVYRDEESSATAMDVEDPSNGGGMILHMANIITVLELLREPLTRKTKAQAKPTTRQQRRLYRFAQHAHRARRSLYRFAQQKGLAIARQQIQQLGQDLDGQAEPSPAMAGGTRTILALALRYPTCLRIPSTLALVMLFLPDRIKRLLNLHDRADLARVFVALVRYWLSKAGGEVALTTWGIMKQPAKAEESGKLVDIEQTVG